MSGNKPGRGFFEAGDAPQQPVPKHRVRQHLTRLSDHGIHHGSITPACSSARKSGEWVYTRFRQKIILDAVDRRSPHDEPGLRRAAADMRCAEKIGRIEQFVIRWGFDSERIDTGRRQPAVQQTLPSEQPRR